MTIRVQSRDHVYVYSYIFIVETKSVSPAGPNAGRAKPRLDQILFIGAGPVGPNDFLFC